MGGLNDQPVHTPRQEFVHQLRLARLLRAGITEEHLVAGVSEPLAEVEQELGVHRHAEQSPDHPDRHRRKAAQSA